MTMNLAKALADGFRARMNGRKYFHDCGFESKSNKLAWHKGWVHADNLISNRRG